jgi:hypothetical protein
MMVLCRNVAESLHDLMPNSFIRFGDFTTHEIDQDGALVRYSLVDRLIDACATGTTRNSLKAENFILLKLGKATLVYHLIERRGRPSSAWFAIISDFRSGIILQVLGKTKNNVIQQQLLPTVLQAVCCVCTTQQRSIDVFISPVQNS